MKIKKYTAQTESEAINKVKADLGRDALILNIKSMKPKGIFKLIRKPSVEVTAALDEKPIANNVDLVNKQSNPNVYEPINTTDDTAIKTIESKIDKIEDLINRSIEQENEATKNIETDEKPMEDNSILEVFYKHLIQNEVEEKLAQKLLYDIKDEEIDDVVAKLYKKLIDIIGEPKPITLTENKPKVIFFVGTTGVGKTTTIAKIATHYALNENKDIGFVTADTYRIAAVEQLKIYAKILNIPVEVIYSSDELTGVLESYKEKDIVFVDTAGRSHKNDEQVDELADMINAIEEKEVYLVLSLTSKYKDLLDIIAKYKDIAKFNIIFTKADETSCLGNLINIRGICDVPYSYIAVGQNVPDDIEVMQPAKVAKALLGGSYSD